jgi:hypothetical protein
MSRLVAAEKLGRDIVPAPTVCAAERVGGIGTWTAAMHTESAGDQLNETSNRGDGSLLTADNLLGRRIYAVRFL